MATHAKQASFSNNAHADYVYDQLQQMRVTDDHAAMLQKNAAKRIHAATTALSDAGHGPRTAADTAADTLSHTHVVERMLDEKAFYPPHDKRTESPAYAKVHHQMTVADDKHCLVCGVQHSTLGDPTKNPFGAIQMETHHHTIEWALANAIDEAKFNQHILPGLKRAAESRQNDAHFAGLAPVYREFDADYASGNMPIARIKEWIDHAADNLWVLCDVHHRHKFVGIHAITYPIWGPQDVVDGTIIEQLIQAAKAAPGTV
jgi:hypothetical protein